MLGWSWGRLVGVGVFWVRGVESLVKVDGVRWVEGVVGLVKVV